MPFVVAIRGTTLLSRAHARTNDLEELRPARDHRTVGTMVPMVPRLSKTSLCRFMRPPELREAGLPRGCPRDHRGRWSRLCWSDVAAQIEKYKPQ